MCLGSLLRISENFAQASIDDIILVYLQQEFTYYH